MSTDVPALGTVRTNSCQQRKLEGGQNTESWAGRHMARKEAMRDQSVSEYGGRKYDQTKVRLRHYNAAMPAGSACS
jgi:hypothetical protein